MEPVRSDGECIASSLREPGAFETVFNRHFSVVHRYLHRRAGRELADELAAETFAVAFERRATCRATGSALPWLYGIATNLLRRRRRTEQRQLRAYGRSGVDRWAEYEDEAAARVDGASCDAGLARALAAMRPRERDALLLYALRRPQLRGGRGRSRGPGRDSAYVAPPRTGDRTTRARGGDGRVPSCDFRS